MRTLKTFMLPALLVTALILAALFGTDSPTNPGITPAAATAPDLAPGSLMQKIHDRGHLRVGTRFDHPGLSASNLKGGQEGFEIDLVEYVAAEMGLRPDQIEWVEASSKNREQFLMQDKVDMVVATYTITEKRKQLISFAGPYATISVDLVVPIHNPLNIQDPQTPRGIKVCSTLGGTVSEAVRKNYPQAQLVEFDVSSKCVDALKNGAVDAYATQGPIGAGYVSKETDHMEMLGHPFTDETWGIGIPKGQTAFCEFINTALQKAETDGSYGKAWDLSLGRYAKTDLKLPEVQPCS